MKDVDKKILLEAAAQVEAANSRVLEIIGMAIDRRDLADHMPQEELVALRGTTPATSVAISEASALA